MIEQVENSSLKDNTLSMELFSEFVHAIRTPLASIKIGTGILKGILPELIRVYLESNADKINENKLSKIERVIANIDLDAERITQYVNDIDQNSSS